MESTTPNSPTSNSSNSTPSSSRPAFSHLRKMRTAVERNDPRFMGCLHEQHDILRSLHDLVIAELPRAEVAAEPGDAVGDASQRVARVFGARQTLERGVRRGLSRAALRSQRREP